MMIKKNAVFYVYKIKKQNKELINYLYGCFIEIYARMISIE